MSYKKNLPILLYLMILTAFCVILIREARGQSVSELDLDPLPITFLQETDRCFQERDVFRTLSEEQKKEILDLKDALAKAKVGRELADREADLERRINAIKDMEIQATRRALEQMGQVADKAIKLAETAKPTSNWALGGILGGIGLIFGLLAK
jgi:hypothetical protein